MRRVFRIPFSAARIGRVQRDVDDELAFHLEARTQRLIAGGLAPEAARTEALQQFGDLASVRQDCVSLDRQREMAMHRINFIRELQQDAGFALRTLRRNIGFAAVIVVALAVGIGANTAIFTLIDAVVVRSLPVEHPAQLVAIGDPASVDSWGSGSPATALLSYPLYRDVRAENTAFSAVLASGRTGRLDVRIDRAAGEPEHPRGRFVSDNYFEVLGVRAIAGRTFDTSADAVQEASPVAEISYGYWTRRLHNDPSVIGRTILVDGVKLAIIGVAPPSFSGEIVGESTDIWLPIAMHDALMPHQRILGERSTNWLLLLGRLRPNVTLAQATHEVSAVMQRSIVANASPKVARAFLARSPTYYVSRGAKGFSAVRDTFTTPLFTLMAGVALLLCIICANVANLLLARALARGREMAVRLALGANRARLLRQLVTESAVLAVLSAGAGLLIAWMGSRALLAMASDGKRLSLGLGMDWRILGFTVLVSVLSVALFGVVPAARASNVDLASTMRGNARSVTGAAGGRLPIGKLLIGGQVALSVVLLAGASILVRSLRNVQSVNVGLDRDHLVIVDLDIQSRGYAASGLAAATHALRDRLGALPGVAAVTFSENGIFSGTEWHTSVEVPGFVAHSQSDTVIATDQVGTSYARGIGARLIAGRDIGPGDEAALPRVALVNESLANFFFPGENAVGRYIHFNDSIAVEIVGVLGDTRDHELETQPARRAYLPYIHAPDPVDPGLPGSLRLEVRTTGDPSAMVQTIRRSVVAVDPALPIDGVDALTTLVRQSIREERLVTKLASAFGMLALVLAAIGLYGVMSYAITRRTGEIGLRMALGAQRQDVLGMVLFDALRLVAAGIAIGVPLSLAATRLLSAQVHGVSTADPFSIAIAVTVLIASAVIAVLIPAVRAARVSPVVALRTE